MRIRMIFHMVTVSGNEYEIQCDKSTFQIKTGYDNYIYESQVVLRL